MKTIVVIPAFNEAARIGPVLDAVRRELPAADICVVNDASTDETPRVARAHGALLLELPVNLGYGAALETGYQFAYRRGYDILLQMDGDGQHLAGELPRILAPVSAGEADLVLGSRYSPGAGRYAGHAVRQLGSRFFCAVLALLTGRRFTDPTTGFQCMNRRTLGLFLMCGFPCDYPDADILFMCHCARLRIREVPVTMAIRSGGRSMHAGLKPLYYLVKMLLSLFIVLLNQRVFRAFAATPAQETPACP